MILSADKVNDWKQAVERVYHAYVGHEIGDWNLHFWNVSDEELVQWHEGETPEEYVEEMILTLEKNKEI